MRRETRCERIFWAACKEGEKGRHAKREAEADLDPQGFGGFVESLAAFESWTTSDRTELGVELCNRGNPAVVHFRVDDYSHEGGGDDDGAEKRVEGSFDGLEEFSG